jgi:hypothetical protein
MFASHICVKIIDICKTIWSSQTLSRSIAIYIYSVLLTILLARHQLKNVEPKDSTAYAHGSLVQSKLCGHRVRLNVIVICSGLALLFELQSVNYRFSSLKVFLLAVTFKYPHLVTRMEASVLLYDLDRYDVRSILPSSACTLTFH